MQLFKLIMMK